MLTHADDYPLHQTAEPIAFAGTDRNFYDRFFFNGYSADGALFFACALGVYPQLNVMDASFAFCLGGRQYNLRASKEMLGDRLNLVIGPIRVEIVRPFEQTRIIIEDNESGLSADIIATGRHFPIEEPRFTRRQSNRVFMDITRATQNVDWQGTITVNGEGHDVAVCCGTRDRSWGVRQVGAAEVQPLAPAIEPQFFWLWTPVNLQTASFFCHTFDNADGTSWNKKAVLHDIAADAKHEWGRPHFKQTYAPGTRRLAGLEITGDGLRAEFSTFGQLFYMQGIGYTHPEWGHGTHHGPLRVGHDVIELDEAETALRAGDMDYIHVQALASVTLEAHGKTHTGVGVMEQFFLGPHAPSGFNDMLDKIVG